MFIEKFAHKINEIILKVLLILLNSKFINLKKKT